MLGTNKSGEVGDEAVIEKREIKRIRNIGLDLLMYLFYGKNMLVLKNITWSNPLNAAGKLINRIAGKEIFDVDENLILSVQSV